MILLLPSENIWGDYYLLSHSQIWLKHANYLSDLISKTIKWHLMKSWICHKPSVGITAKRWWFVSTNFKISTSMTTLWHFSGSYARTGRNIRTYAIACTAAKDICYWIFFIITTCLSINSGTSYFWKRVFWNRKGNFRRIMRHDYRPDEESPLLYPTIKSASVV